MPRWLIAMSVILACLYTQFDATRALGSGKPQDESATLTAIGVTIAQLHSEVSSYERANLAEKLANLIREVNPNKIRDAEIDEISDLLGDSFDPVRMWCAFALGNIGPRALRAIPALQNALKSPIPVTPSFFAQPTMDSSMAIQTALRKIRGGSSGPEP